MWSKCKWEFNNVLCKWPLIRGGARLKVYKVNMLNYAKRSNVEFSLYLEFIKKISVMIFPEDHFHNWYLSIKTVLLRQKKSGSTSGLNMAGNVSNFTWIHVGVCIQILNAEKALGNITISIKVRSMCSTNLGFQISINLTAHQLSSLAYHSHR